MEQADIKGETVAVVSGRYSCRSDCTGSTRNARRAGPSAAAMATNVTDSTAAAITIGSREVN